MKLIREGGRWVVKQVRDRNVLPPAQITEAAQAWRIYNHLLQYSDSEVSFLEQAEEYRARAEQIEEATDNDGR